MTETLTLQVTLTYDPDTETLYEAQQRFLETLTADGLHHAVITDGLVDADGVAL